MTHERHNNIQLLQLLVDYKDKHESEYRFLVDGKDVKYVAVGPGLLGKSALLYDPVPTHRFPAFPPGDWNEGYVSKDIFTDDLLFSWVTRSSLPGVKTAWHPTSIDHLEFKILHQMRQNIHVVAHPLFDRPVVIKFAAFPWQVPYLEAETRAYQWIQGKRIGPEFLGHVTEAGRVIGFIMEYIESSRTSEPRDLAVCRHMLRKLHFSGIKHGDMNKHNFLIRNGHAVLIDFETTRKCSDKAELERELRRLEKLLGDPLRRAGLGLSFATERIIY